MELVTPGQTISAEPGFLRGETRVCLSSAAFQRRGARALLTRAPHTPQGTGHTCGKVCFWHRWAA